ncbi:MAG: MFS transporter [Anaerolineae bacterium]
MRTPDPARIFRQLDPWQRNLWALVVTELLTITAFQAGYILIPYYIQQMGITEISEVAAWTGAYQSIGSVAFAIATPIWGVLGDRFGRKLMLVRSMIATFLVLALMGLAQTPGQLIALRVIQGAFTGTVAAATTLAAATAPRARLAYSLGLIQTSVLVGASLGPMLGGFVGDLFGYRYAFIAAAVIVALSTLLMVRAVHEPKHESTAAKQAAQGNALGAFRAVLTAPRVGVLAIITFAINLTFGLMGPVLPLFVQQLVEDPSRVASAAGTISGVTAITAAAAALSIGRVSDSIGHRRTLLACVGGMSLFYLPLAIVRSTVMLGVVRGVHGLFQGGISPSTSAMVVRQARPDNMGAALGISSSAASVGAAIGPMLGALLMATSSPQAVFLISAGIFAIITGYIALRLGSGADSTPRPT